jgi:hypothetical protein
VQFLLDDKNLGEPMDLFNPNILVTNPPASLGTHELSAGQHRLTVEIVGVHKKGLQRSVFGLHCLMVEPVE